MSVSLVDWGGPGQAAGIVFHYRPRVRDLESVLEKYRRGVLHERRAHSVMIALDEDEVLVSRVLLVDSFTSNNISY